jgi:cellobiose transport system substrate-binding protein
MKNGDFAVVAAPSWTMTNISQIAPGTAGKWYIGYLPGDGGNWGGSQLAIPATSEHAKEAYKLITWLLSPGRQPELFQMHANFSSMSELHTTRAIPDFSGEFFSGSPVGPIYARSALAIEPFLERPEPGLIGSVSPIPPARSRTARNLPPGPGSTEERQDHAGLVSRHRCSKPAPAFPTNALIC